MKDKFLSSLYKEGWPKSLGSLITCVGSDPQTCDEGGEEASSTGPLMKPPDDNLFGSVMSL